MAGSNNRKHNVALFIDTANCSDTDFDQVLYLAREHGEVVAAQAYGNFANGNQRLSNEMARKLYLLGVRLIHCPAWRNGSGEWKSIADETLMNDVCALLYTKPSVSHYIICSGDGHYVPTICEIKRKGKEAIVMADPQAACRFLVEAADKFIPLHPAATSVPEEVYRALVQAVSSLQETRGRAPVPAANLKPKMIKLLGEFDEGNYRSRNGRAFRQFTEFLKEAQSEGWVRLSRQNGMILVTAPSGDPQAT